MVNHNCFTNSSSPSFSSQFGIELAQKLGDIISNFGEIVDVSARCQHDDEENHHDHNQHHQHHEDPGLAGGILDYLLVRLPFLLLLLHVLL